MNIIARMALALSCCLYVAQASALQPQVGDISDNRTTGQFFSGLEVEMKLIGDELADVAGIRAVVKSAIDETGKSLVDPEKSKGEFEELGKFGNSNSIKLKFKNPSRKAANIKELNGTLDLFVPKNDPGATVSVPLAQAGKPVSAPTLTSSKIDLTVFTQEQYAAKQKADAEEAKKKALAQGMPANMANMLGGMFGGNDANSLYFILKDPESKMIGIKVVDSAGKEISTNGSMSSGDMRQVYFSQPLPPDAKVQVQVATQRALLSVPFSFQNVALP